LHRPASSVAAIGDILIFMAILAAFAALLLALAVAAPLAIAVTAVAGALSASVAGGEARCGWRRANA
jgi:hypothetical protein